MGATPQEFGVFTFGANQVSQAGGAAPTMVVVYNTLGMGAVPTWARSVAGTYVLTFSTMALIFSTSNILVFFGQGTGNAVLTASRAGANSIIVTSLAPATGTATDSLINGASLLVYAFP